MSGQLEALQPFLPYVHASRDAFLASLSEVPEELRNIVKDWFGNRVGRAAPLPLLGEYVPWIVADQRLLYCAIY